MTRRSISDESDLCGKKIAAWVSLDFGVEQLDFALSKWGPILINGRLDLRWSSGKLPHWWKAQALRS